jgi:hypothetical protein
MTSRWGAEDCEIASAYGRAACQSVEWIWEPVRNHWSGIIDWVSPSRNQTERFRPPREVSIEEMFLPRHNDSSLNTLCLPARMAVRAQDFLST